jgi:uncharacterized membrane protein YhaH (DUF805 family)
MKKELSLALITGILYILVAIGGSPDIIQLPLVLIVQFVLIVIIVLVSSAINNKFWPKTQNKEQQKST